MAHRYRFFGDRVSDTRWRIDSGEYNHISNVLRLACEDAVEVCDGKGCWAVGAFERISKREITVLAKETFVEQPIERHSEIVLGALKTQSMDVLIPDLVELGVTAIHIFGQVDVAKARLSKKVIDRWHRVIESSVKQCKRPWLPVLTVHDSLESYMSYKSYTDSFDKFIAYHEGESLVAQVSSSTRNDSVSVVGGEKGFSHEELKILREAGFVTASIGSSILKAMTAAVACAAIQSYIFSKND